MLATKLISSIEHLMQNYEHQYGVDLCIATPIDYAIASASNDSDGYDVYVRYVYGIYPDESITNDCLAHKMRVINRAAEKSTTPTERRHFIEQHEMMVEIKCWLDAYYARP
jgi:hypothetical protein